MKYLSTLLFFACSAASWAQAPDLTSPDLWKPANVPFSFVYGGKPSSQLLATWQASDETVTAGDAQIHRYDYIDPATHLKVTAEVRLFPDFPGTVDWVLKFTNEGTADTPIIENILPLNWTTACADGPAFFHSALGSGSSPTDFAPIDRELTPGLRMEMMSGSGRSSDYGPGGGGAGQFPFFGIQTGDHGVLGAIGWTGSWRAPVSRDPSGKNITCQAGMLATHLLLHPGETIRTPRILLMNWKGDLGEAQNTWRQLMISHYSPKDPQGRTVVMPLCWNTWGTEFASVKLGVIKGLAEQKIPADAYWIDAGWYEPLTLSPGQGYNVQSGWNSFRGDWVVSKTLYPDTMRPIGEALKAAGIGFIVWFEPETADNNSANYRAHPDRYLKLSDLDSGLLNLGNPDARKWITDTICDFITHNGLTWYRQDFNVAPAPYWTKADAPDRVGMSEIKSITGLYQYWDDLRARNPGLQIDNCASGGRRLDIETMSRSVALWRSDFNGDPMAEQVHTEALAPWDPMTSGAWTSLKGQSPPTNGPLQLYAQRSAYCAGLTVCIDQDPAPWLKQAFDEFHEVRPYFMGDFYRLVFLDLNPASWAAWQLQMPDHKSGLVMVFRRPKCVSQSVQLHLQAIDPAAQYDVEMRTGLDKAPVKKMSGSDLAGLQPSIADTPGSMLVFYRKE
jgi:alpha-galactosidase